MENKVLKNHIKGKRSVGKTDWSKILVESNRPKIDDENPELVGKRQFKKVEKKLTTRCSLT
ncbi:hypothetical protein [Shewanella baltica]|uniref:hypothetical protein n=1 Tax=Shewanella baltica TaxID=62322 RepID=UPI00217D5A1B|nr:hypothetical protein [Shewanella baltica]MCS6180045.1 hypothetical protein [Shewanella baltica]MCS6256136.1 hypothetical protein [Shewanella baltica]